MNRLLIRPPDRRLPIPARANDVTSKDYFRGQEGASLIASQERFSVSNRCHQPFRLPGQVLDALEAHRFRKSIGAPSWTSPLHEPRG